MIKKIEDLPSRLRKRIILQQRAENADGAGGLTIMWEDFATIWAEIMPRRGTESFFAGQISNSVSYKITLRFISGVNEKMRIKFGARIFNIISILNIEERNEMLEIFVEEEVI